MESPTSPKSVHTATKQDLVHLWPHLRKCLPESCDIYQCLATLIASDKDVSRFYFTRGADGNFDAILNLAEDKCLDDKKKELKVWLIAQWASNEESLIRIFESLSQVEWGKHGFVIFGPGRQPALPLSSFFDDYRLHLKLYQVKRYFIDIESALNFQIEIPGDVYVKSLEQRHASIVFEHWPYNRETLEERVADEIDRMPSAGLFLKEGDHLVSWIMSSPPNGLSRLHTMDAYRRRGYAHLVIQYMSKRVAQCGYIPFVNVLETNEPSLKCFDSLGFRLLRSKYCLTHFPNQC